MAGRSASALPARYHNRASYDVTSGSRADNDVTSGLGPSAFENGGVTPSLMEDPHYVNTLTEDERDLIAEVLNRDAKIKELEDKRYSLGCTLFLVVVFSLSVRRSKIDWMRGFRL